VQVSAFNLYDGPHRHQSAGDVRPVASVDIISEGFDAAAAAKRRVWLAYVKQDHRIVIVGGHVLVPLPHIVEAEQRQLLMRLSRVRPAYLFADIPTISNTSASRPITSFDRIGLPPSGRVDISICHDPISGASSRAARRPCEPIRRRRARHVHKWPPPLVPTTRGGQVAIAALPSI
jgi:hypothetical protein